LREIFRRPARSPIQQLIEHVARRIAMSDATTPATRPTPQPVGGDSAFGRLIGAFVSPKQTFASIAARPSWFLPLIVIAIFATAMFFVFGQRVGWRINMMHQIEQSERAQKQMEQLTPEKRDAVIDQQAKVSMYVVYFLGSAGVFIFALIVAGLLLLAFMIIADVRPTFSQSLGIVSHAWLPGIITVLLGILVIYLKDPSTVDLQNLVASNLGALAPESSPKWLSVFLSTFDVFTFWKIALMAFGFSAVDPKKKLSVGKAFTIVFVLYLVWMLIVTGFTARFS
jgi:hypothetical protein